MKRALCLLLVLFTVAPNARAEQVIVAEATYTHSAQTTKDSHYRVEPTPETPADWTEPVDYAHGSVHVRLEVATKPTSTPTRYQVCFEMQQNYCCTEQAPSYTTAGVYEWDTPVEELWRPGPVDFARGILRSALILKDTNNVKPAPENVGEATSKLYMPTDLHVVVTLVSAGDEYSSGDEPPVTGGAGGSGAGGESGGGADTAGSGEATSAGGTSRAGSGNAGSAMGEHGGVGGTASTAGNTSAAGNSRMVGGAAGFNPNAADSSASCGIHGAPTSRQAWLGLVWLGLARRRRRTPSG